MLYALDYCRDVERESEQSSWEAALERNRRALIEEHQAAWPQVTMLGLSRDATDDPREPWKVRVEHDEHPGRVFELDVGADGAIVRFAVEASLGEITARESHGWPIGYLRDACRTYVQMHLFGLDVGELAGGLVTATSAAWSEGFARRKRPGRAGRLDLEYARTAGAYVKHMRRSTTPLADLAGEMCLSASQVRSILYEARRRGLLTAAPKGRAGGELTEKALRLLEGEA